ncbi:tyrosine-type recombinase/integrase [Marinobacter sp. M5B]|uniref:tyrosine-type recombinase/integrase n=1 Tax=Marinobacter sp. M5B TaxID=3141535 RepID=UPI0036D27301
MTIELIWESFFALELETETRQAAQKLQKFLADSPSKAAKFLSGRLSKTCSAQEMRELENEVHESLGKRQDTRYGKVLRLFVEYANRNGGNSIPLPAVPIRLEAQPSVFTDFSPINAEGAEDWRLCLSRWLESAPAIDSRLGAGALLVSASLNSGVVDSGALLELLKAASHELTVVGGRAYIDLQLPWRGSANLERRRWLPDAVSESIFLRLKINPEELPKPQSPAKSLWPLIKSWFEDSDCCAKNTPRNFSEFIRASKALNYHEVPMDVGAYMARRHISHSLRPEAWQRLHHVYPGTDDPEIPFMHLEKVEGGSKTDAGEDPVTETFEWASALWRALKGEDRECAAQKLKKLLEDGTYSVGKPERLLTEWALALCTKPASSGKGIALSTTRQYLTQAGKRLAALSGDEDIASFDATELEELYVEVISDGQNPGFTDKLRRGLREFHHFLHHQYGVPKLSEVMNLGGGSILHPVDANIISLDEYHEIRARIRDADLELKAPGLSVIAELIFVLGFRCGLRRMETLALRIRDVHLLGRPEIIVRRYHGHRLKTENAKRKMPVQALLDEDELKLLRDWVNHRRSEEQVFSRCEALFSIPQKAPVPIDQEQVIPVIHGIMRQVAGDPSLRYHHLRHSFASWTYLRLSLAQHGKHCELFHDQPLTEQWLNQSNDLQERLLGERHRVNLYSVARLLGHAGPDMSLEHYVHTLDLAGLAIDERRAVFTEKTLVAASGVPESSAYRLLKNAGVAGLLKRVRADHPRKVNELLPNAKPNLRSEPEEGTLQFTLASVERYLKYRQGTPIEKKVLAERFGLSEEECSLIESQRDYLAALRSNDKRIKSSRHRFVARTAACENSVKDSMDLHTEPRTQTSKEAYQEFTDRVELLLKENSESVWEVVDYYIHNQWKTWNALIFRDPDKPEMARKYLQFLEAIGFRRRQLQFVCCDPRGRSVPLAGWKRALGLTARDTIKRREPTNKQSKAVADWLFIAPDFGTECDEFDDRLFGYRYFMVMLATAMPVLNPRSA